MAKRHSDLLAEIEGDVLDESKPLASALRKCAAALDVTPVLLVLPLGRQETVEALPGRDIPTWEAAMWFCGGGELRQTPAGLEVFWNDDGVVPLFLEHQRLASDLHEDQVGRAGAVTDDDIKLWRGWWPTPKLAFEVCASEAWRRRPCPRNWPMWTNGSGCRDCAERSHWACGVVRDLGGLTQPAPGRFPAGKRQRPPVTFPAWLWLHLSSRSSRW